MKEILVLVVAIGFLGGCASNVRNEVNRYEHEISSSRNNIAILESKIARENENIENYKSSISKSNNSIRDNKQNIERARIGISRSKAYLSSHSDVFINGQCIRPDFGPKPTPYCSSRSEAKEHALAFCSMSAGCDAAMLLASDELDTFSKRFLASEACSRAVHELRNEGYAPDSTAVNALEALSDTGCSNESDGFFAFLGKVSGCIMSASIKLAKIQSYVNCTERKANSCYSSYTDWLGAPENRERECLENFGNIDTYANAILKYERQIAENERSIRSKKQNIKSSSDSIAQAEQELARERERNSKYNRLLAERKKTLAYKLYGK
ncbi:hypothetical protein [Pseudoalteromonas piscicida]|uniref:Lipoprotein n=1 Tax=Pseudoalteromonas piscicida TaxID=43662 RepID=A0A2A5JM57_PSEO7|nr:hypothetical protein [Pseudoalteromonas piscicida]PCK30506.1 hypothetical protein CEX98_17005 [Pseudoalteromonas piscicida]